MRREVVEWSWSKLEEIHEDVRDLEHEVAEVRAQVDDLQS